MRSYSSYRPQPGATRRRWLSLLYPELRRVSAPRWGQALRRARQTDLSPLERAGVLAAVGVATYVLQPLADPDAAPVVRYIQQFMLALPVVALLASPWLVRRTRRGLQREAGPFHGDDPCPESHTAAGTDPSTVEPHRTSAPRRVS